MRVTRRDLARLLAAAAVASQTAPAQTPQASRPPESAAELLRSARDEIQKSAAAIHKLQVPFATEPAFSFRAL
jgi:hypothetical protein